MRTFITLLIVLATGFVGAVSTANAMTLEALCSQDYVKKEVLRFAKRVKFPVNAKGMKPDIAGFPEEAGPMACKFVLTTGNIYDFGEYKATFEDLGYNRVRVISLTPLD